LVVDCLQPGSRKFYEGCDGPRGFRVRGHFHTSPVGNFSIEFDFHHAHTIHESGQERNFLLTAKPRKRTLSLDSSMQT